ncbi:hypothetical protein V6N12_063404 [Hibiscus sabdariffa]|uniref:Uncharacterized protein n=1 Tax=Hibiscus sabdariffa TaxID=183260 RepID=A0ABR2FBN8_9ROSI
MVDKNVDKQKGIVIRVENLLRTNCNREMRQTWNKEATIHICDENTIHSYFSGKKAPYTGVENYNLSRDLKSFLFHATDKNLAYVSPRFLLGSQSFVMDASERSKFIVNLEFVLIVVQGLSGMVRQAKKLVSQGSWQCLSGKCCCNADLGLEATCF